MTLKVSVLGCGNSLVGDDAVGLEVLRILEELSPEVPGLDIRLVEAATGGLDIIEYLRDRERAVIIDAILGGGQAGEIRVFDATEIPDPVVPAFSLHGIDLPHALALGRRLYPGEMPRVTVVGIEVGRRPEPTDRRLSPPVAAAVEPGAGAVLAVLHEWSREVCNDA